MSRSSPAAVLSPGSRLGGPGGGLRGAITGGGSAPLRPQSRTPSRRSIPGGGSRWRPRGCSGF
eukprot:1732970-Pyramimonas_sp.AAC.1